MEVTVDGVPAFDGYRMSDDVALSSKGDGVNYARACGVTKDKACPASQSSTSHGGDPERAVDTGGLDGAWSSGSCTHTASGSDPGGAWWRLDMQQQVKVIAMTVVGRSDCCETLTKGLSIFVGDSEDIFTVEKGPACVFNHQPHLPKGGALDVTCDAPVSGKYVYFILPPGQPLTLCEVEVWG